MPNLKKEKFTSGNLDWLASMHATSNCRTETLDHAAIAAKAVDGVIPSGLPLAKKSGKLVPYNSAGSAGEEKLIGVLMWDVNTPTADVAVAVLDQGRIYTDKLPGGSFTVPTADKDLTQFVYTTKEG